MITTSQNINEKKYKLVKNIYSDVFKNLKKREKGNTRKKI